MSIQPYGGGYDRLPAPTNKGFLEALFTPQPERAHNGELARINYRADEVALQDHRDAQRTRELNRYSTALGFESMQMTNALCDEALELAEGNAWKFSQLAQHATDASGAMRARNRDFNMGR